MARVSSRRMHKLRTDFFLEGQHAAEQAQALAAEGLEQEAAELRAQAACWLCGQDIDYTVPANTTPDSHNLDHFHPVSEYPELQEDPANFRHSHALCNTERGNNAPRAGLGVLSRNWTG